MCPALVRICLGLSERPRRGRSWFNSTRRYHFKPSQSPVLRGFVRIRDFAGTSDASGTHSRCVRNSAWNVQKTPSPAHPPVPVLRHSCQDPPAYPGLVCVSGRLPTPTHPGHPVEIWTEPDRSGRFPDPRGVRPRYVRGNPGRTYSPKPRRLLPDEFGLPPPRWPWSRCRHCPVHSLA